MKTYAFRLSPQMDLKKELVRFTKENNIKAGVILSAVGSLSAAKIRLADERVEAEFDSKFEIVSLTGTLCQDGVHLHISISDSKGKVIGGHLLDGCIIYTTAEMVIGVIENIVFSREYDCETGFNELKITSVEAVNEL